MNNNQQHIELITGYLQGTLTEQERQELHRLIANGEIDQQKIREMVSLYNRINSLEPPEPEASLSNRFYAMLEDEKRKQTDGSNSQLKNWFNGLRSQFQLKHVAYACIIFGAGLLVGDISAPVSNQDEQIDRLSAEVHQLREMMMISLLDDASPFERLKAVNISNEIRSGSVDGRVIEALLRTLNNDSNVNVRLAAVEALVQHAQHPAARSGLVNAITRQESPVVQSALADAMITLQEKQSVDEFKKLLARNELDTTVRNKLENTIVALN